MTGRSYDPTLYASGHRDIPQFASVVEMADTRDLKSLERKFILVRFQSEAPLMDIFFIGTKKKFRAIFLCSRCAKQLAEWIRRGYGGTQSSTVCYWCGISREGENVRSSERPI